MSEDREATPEAATYDVEAVQDKWRKVWDDLDSFPRARPPRRREALRADDVPLPER